MKVLFFTDIHCTKAAEFSRPTNDGLTQYLQLVLRSAEFVCEVIRAQRPDVIVFGGDLWDALEYVDTVSLHVGVKVFELISSAGAFCKKYALVGNHDYWSITHGIHRLKFLEQFKWSVIDQPRMVACSPADGFLALPYRDEYPDVSALPSRRLYPNAPLFAVAHADFIGAAYNKAAKSTSGLNLADLVDIPVVLNGHFHNPSRYKNLVNVGSLLARDFRDKDAGWHGVAILDTDTCQVTRYDNPHDRLFSDILLKSDDDVASALELDLVRQCARVYYTREFEDEARVLQELLAGCSLVPLKSYVKQGGEIDATHNDIVAAFSLEENLRSYLERHYRDEEIVTAARDVFSASKEGTSHRTRDPLEFGVLDLCNFMSYSRLRLDLRQKGFVLLRGSNLDELGQDDNGSGKTSLIEAINWVLTGKSLRKYSVKEVIKWGEEYVRGSLEIYRGDTKLTVIRTRKDPELGTGISILEDGEEVGARLKSITQDVLNDILGRSEKSLKHICLISADPASKFTSLNLDNRARLLEDIIDVTAFRQAQKISGKRAQAAQTKFYTSKGKVTAACNQIKRLEELCVSLAADIEEFDSNAKSKIDSLNADIVDTQRVRQECLDQKSSLDSELLTLQDINSAAKSKLKVLEEAARRVQDEISSCKADLAVANDNLARMRNLAVRDTCPTCETPLDKSVVTVSISHHEVQKGALVLKVKDLRSKALPVTTRILKLRDFMEDNRLERMSRYTRVSELQERVRSAEGHIRDLQIKLGAVSLSKDRLISRFDDKQAELRLAMEDEVRYSEEAKLADKEYEIYCTLRDDIFDEQGVRRDILGKVAVVYLNDRLPEHSSSLLPGDSLEIADDLEVILPTPKSYRGASSGQRARIDLCIQLALNDLAVATGRSKVGFLGIDEALVHMDEFGIAAAMDVLKRKAVEGTVLLVSHKRGIPTPSGTTIWVAEKEGGTTTIKEMSDAE